MSGHLPTFLLVGAMKSGTTSLHEYLDVHPQICMAYPKEPNFFVSDSDMDLESYKSCFDGNATEYGEASTNYTKYPAFEGVPELIHDLLPDVKILYLVRDPVERAVSHYVHNRIHDRESDPIDEAFLPPEESHYIQTSRYYFQISRYLEYFSLDQVLIVQSEALRSRRAEVLARICDFLGVRTQFDASVVEDEYHTTSKKLDPGISSFLQESAIGRAVSSVGASILPQALIERGLDLFRTSVERPTLGDEARRQVVAYLESDVDALREIADNDFSEWAV